MKLSDKALLVNLSISQWMGKKHDKNASQLVTDSYGATASAGRFNKVLLPANDHLVAVHKKAAFIREEFYKNTLPWALQGTMMLPSTNYLAFMNKFRTYRDEWMALVEVFLANYLQAKIQAQSQLTHGLYRDSDYPSEREMRSKFVMDLSIYPVPTNDFRVEISDAELASIHKDVETRVKNSMQTAMKDVWSRLYERVEAMAEKLSDPNAVIRADLLENTLKICEILPRLNFTNDPDLEAVRLAVETKLASHHVDTLRHNPTARHKAAIEANDLKARMNVFMAAID